MNSTAESAAHPDSDPAAFVAAYSEADRSRIAFAWNGKHASDFAGSNQSFRWAIVDHCISHPSQAPIALLKDLFSADAEWSRDAWGAPHHFADLGALLLQRGQESVIAVFSEGFNRSFDTFGACHGMSLSPPLADSLSAFTKTALSNTTDELDRKRLSAAQELFDKLREGTARQGWVSLAPGAPVSDVRVVWPRWYHKLWHRIAKGCVRKSD